MLGPIAFVILYQGVTKRVLKWSASLKNTGFLILGLVLGASFHREAVLNVLPHVPFMTVTTLLTVVFALFTGRWLAKKTDLDWRTGIFASVPGGLSQMVAISQEMEGVDTTAVALIQTIRVMAVIFLVPFLTVHGVQWFEWGSLNEGASVVDSPEYFLTGRQFALLFILGLISAFAAKRLFFPAPFLIGPLLMTAVINLAGWQVSAMPHPLVIVSQLMVGTGIGMSMKLTGLKQIGRLLGYTLMSSLLLILFSIGLGLALSWMTSIDVPTAILSTAPGGVAEMGLTAVIVRADLSIVSSYQLFRMFVMVVLMPIFLKIWMRHVKTGQIKNSGKYGRPSVVNKGRPS
jgi:hypothetical protein